MNENERYIADSIRVRVRSGFYSLPDIYSMTENIMETIYVACRLRRLVFVERL